MSDFEVYFQILRFLTISYFRNRGSEIGKLALTRGWSEMPLIFGGAKGWGDPCLRNIANLSIELISFKDSC